MSTRWYPLYQKGNPQLRVFLPNFWMKLIKSFRPSPPNIVHFEVSMEMTKYDIKNYLEKIYGVKTVEIRTRIRMGDIKKSVLNKSMVKDDDVKIAYAVLPKDEVWKYPDLKIAEIEKKNMKYDKATLKQIKQNYTKIMNKHAVTGTPGWFSM